MKTIYLIRHAKSSWDMNVADWQRPLNEASIERAHKIANLMHEKGIKPDKIISSFAFRALNTAIIFAKTLEFSLEDIEISGDIYEKKAPEIFKLIQRQNDKYKSIMLVGHNPCITVLYNMLTGRMLDNMNTSAVAGIGFNADKWDAITIPGNSLFLETGKE